MVALSRDDHRRRVLEFQSKSAADKTAPVTGTDAQLKIQLIGEARLIDQPQQAKRGRKRLRKPAQPELGKL